MNKLKFWASITHSVENLQLSVKCNCLFRLNFLSHNPAAIRVDLLKIVKNACGKRVIQNITKYGNTLIAVIAMSLGSFGARRSYCDPRIQHAW